LSSLDTGCGFNFAVYVFVCLSRLLYISVSILGILTAGAASVRTRGGMHMYLSLTLSFLGMPICAGAGTRVRMGSRQRCAKSELFGGPDVARLRSRCLFACGSVVGAFGISGLGFRLWLSCCSWPRLPRWRCEYQYRTVVFLSCLFYSVLLCIRIPSRPSPPPSSVYTQTQVGVIDVIETAIGYS
jgi:hypothetical protein